MYGMLLESVQHFVQRLHGNRTWNQIMLSAGVQNVVFTTHGRYSDSTIIRLAVACAEVVRDRTKEEYMCFFGQCFVEYCSHYGYDKIMRISGRHYRDFLRGIDNLHETMRFSYPKMQNPSLYVEKEDVNGCILHYRSRRVGFTHYVIGQLTQFATLFYNVHVDIDVIREEVNSKGCHVIFRLNFDNAIYRTIQDTKSEANKTQNLEFPPLPQNVFFKVFPFCMVFNSHMIITRTGASLPLLFRSDVIGEPVRHKFLLRRPRMEFTFENVMLRQSVLFELEVKDTGRRVTSPDNHRNDVVLLKGQMIYISELNGIAFLCTPLLGDLADLEYLGLKINDLSMYDFSRDMVLRGWQHSSALEYTIEKQVEKSEQIAENLKQLDEWKSRSEQLLYAMIPRSIAERLQNGEHPINTCRTFESVTIMFCYLVGFTEFCMRMPALQCIETINFIFTEFDNVVDDFGIFKVETLGDAVYMAAGGVPDPTDDHGPRVAGVALKICELVKDRVTLSSSSQGQQNGQGNFNVRIGLHTGGVVGGVVGKRTPQYCLFGDSVNTASRMQTYSQPGEIHISEPCYKELQGHGFSTVLRGTMDIKGKGSMKTYWLVGTEGKQGVGLTSNTYTEVEQKADQTKVLQQPCNGQGGFIMETTVKCQESHSCLDDNSDPDEEEPEVDLDLPECPMTTVNPPKISVEDFKTFMETKRKSAEMSQDSSNSESYGTDGIECPFSGMRLQELKLNDIASKFTKTKSHKVCSAETLMQENVSTLMTSGSSSMSEDQELCRRKSEPGKVNIKVTDLSGCKVDPPSPQPGQYSRLDTRRSSCSSLTLLDELRTNMDGVTNRLKIIETENNRKLTKFPAQRPVSDPFHTSIDSLKVKQQSPCPDLDLTLPAFDTLKVNQPTTLGVSCSLSKSTTRLPAEAAIFEDNDSRCTEEEAVKYTTLTHSQSDFTLRNRTSNKSNGSPLSASFVEATRFWQQREHDALQHKRPSQKNLSSQKPH